MNTKETKKNIIQAGQKAVEELIKVAKEPIVDSDDDISADRLKNAAATKKLAIFDAFEILNRIQEEANLLEGKIPEEKKEITSNNNIIIKSPMIGTFYRSPNPESDPFINEGDSIKVGQTICIVEAMKLFNDIESEVSGKIVKILVDDNSPGEYDQPLFEVDPS